VFGLSLGEILMLLIVGIVVVGPRRLPDLMRTAGKWVGKIRRMSVELRAQSGIDDLIRQEGLERELHELRSLSRSNVLNSLMTPMASALSTAAPRLPASSATPRPPSEPRLVPLREREYPTLGCDAYGALPDDGAPYVPEGLLPPEEAAEDAVERPAEDAVERPAGDAVEGPAS
jgi:sec-independent protein translocase protein TatB